MKEVTVDLNQSCSGMSCVQRSTATRVSMCSSLPVHSTFTSQIFIPTFFLSEERVMRFLHVSGSLVQ